MNKLANESSPYLKQHANNPINWYPWSEEAFKIAREQNKLIFLSIGYSTCHWCHVMAKECFEDEEIADLLNQHYISIKVDREERPDIDSLYMKFCQVLTGSGGWPLTLILTNDQKPLFVGTYLPKYDKNNIIGLLNLLNKIIEIKNTNPTHLYEFSNNILKKVNESKTIKSIKQTTNNTEINISDIYHNLFRILNSAFDYDFGGFGNTTKFPQIPYHLFLLSYSRLFKSSESLSLIEKTLINIFAGGIYDHIEFGLHRYSVDRYWYVPHFEKMLYDQAMMILLLSELYDYTKKEKYKKHIKEITLYTNNHLMNDTGTFYSAEDADNDGKEGLYYLWDIEELKATLKDDFNNFIQIFQINEKSKYENNYYVLLLNKEIPDTQYKIFESNLRPILKERKLQRKPPNKDTKILTDWNGLMIAALSKASHVLNQKENEKEIKKSLDWFLNHYIIEGNLIHYKQNQNKYIEAFLLDYASIINALLSYYIISSDNYYLTKAIDLNNDLLDKYYKNGQLFNKSINSEKLIIEIDEHYDSVIPSGLSLTVENLILLHKITGDNKYILIKEQIINNYKNDILDNIHSYPYLLYVLSKEIIPFYKLIINKKYDIYETKQILLQNFIPISNIMISSTTDEKSNIHYQICDERNCNIFFSMEDVIIYFKEKISLASDNSNFSN